VHEILTTALHAGRAPESARPALDQMLGHLEAPARAGRLAAAARESGALSRQEAISGVAQVLDRLAEDEPGVLFLEDLQWATPPALSLVEHLVARPSASPWLVIATARDDEAHGAWRRLLGRPGVLHLGLPPLDTAGTLGLLQAMLSFEAPPEALAARLVALCGGRPLHVIESLKQMFALGRLQHRGDHWAATDAAGVAPGAGADSPADTAPGELFWARFAALPPTELETARLLAVFGRPVAVTTLADALGRVSARRAASRAVQAVETLARLGLVVLDQDLDGSRTAALAQKSARDEVYRRLPPIRRRVLHGAALLALEAIGSGFAEERCEDLARHAEAAGDGERAEKYLLASAARAKAAFDPVAESAYLSRALDTIPRRDERRLPILGRVVELVTSAIADHKAGGRLSRQLAREARAARSHHYEIMGLRSEAWTRAFLGDESGARLLLAKAIRLARETDDTSELVNALMYLASVLSRGHRNSEVQPYLDEAIGLARRDDDPTPLMVLLATEGLNRLVTGDAAASVASFEEALHVAERRERRASYYSVLGNLGMAHLDLGDLSRARDTIERGLDWSREHALVNHCIEQTRSLAWLHMLNGRYDRAAALAVETRRWRAAPWSPPITTGPAASTSASAGSTRRAPFWSRGLRRRAGQATRRKSSICSSAPPRARLRSATTRRRGAKRPRRSDSRRRTGTPAGSFWPTVRWSAPAPTVERTPARTSKRSRRCPRRGCAFPIAPTATCSWPRRFGFRAPPETMRRAGPAPSPKGPPAPAFGSTPGAPGRWPAGPSRTQHFTPKPCMPIMKRSRPCAPSPRSTRTRS
jgi:tetratricopeptide (TPR) repeat protein